MKQESRKKVRISELNFKNIGDRITFIRMMHGKTIDEFAAMLGISKGNLSDLENNKNKPSYEVIAVMAGSFNINSEWILTGNGKLFKRLYPFDTEIPDNEIIETIIGGNFEDKDTAFRMFYESSRTEKISPSAFREVADYISLKLQNLLKFGERRLIQRRENNNPESVPQGRDRRSGSDRRSHELYRIEK